MKTFIAWCLPVLAGVTACQHAPPAPSGQSDVDSKIAYYRSRIGGPASYPAEARLGLAYLQKARESGQPEYSERALRHLLCSLEHQPNFEALLGAALVCIERHEFTKALGYAEQAVTTMPTDLDAQGVLFDSLLALGETQRAAQVADKMLQLKPGFAAFTRRAALNSYRGELRAAVEAMERACKYADDAPLLASTRAWARVRLGSLHIANCEPAAARQNYQAALRLYPGYFLALEHMAELDAAEGRIDKAIHIYRDLLKRIPTPNYRLALAELYVLAGEERKANAERQKAVANLRKAVEDGSKAELRELALQLLDSGAHAKEALELAQRDWENRKDATAADTLACAFFHSGSITEALKYAKHALNSGTKDPQILFHAGLIHLRAGHTEEAKGLIAQARSCPWNLAPADRIEIDRAWTEVNRLSTRP